MATKTRKVAVLGWYGHRNFGDDEIVLEGLKQLFRDWQIVVMSNNDKATYPKIDFATVNKCDLFVLGGGELINTHQLFLPSPWAHHIKIPKIILGCGVNAESAKKLKRNVIKDLEKFDFIGLRDNASVDILKSIPQLKSKVELFHDLAFAINTNGLHWKNTKKDTALIIPTDRYTNKSDRGIRRFNLAVTSQNWLKEKIEPYGTTVFLPFGEEDNDDFKTSCSLLSVCRKHGEIFCPSQLSLETVLNLISNCALVVPYRLHGLILSFMVGAKYEFYPYHWKLTRVHDTIVNCNVDTIRLKQRELFNDAIHEVTA